MWCVVCGGSHLRSFLRSPAAGGSKTTPEQVYTNMMGSPHYQVPPPTFFMDCPSRILDESPWSPGRRLRAAERKRLRNQQKVKVPNPTVLPLETLSLLLWLLRPQPTASEFSTRGSGVRGGITDFQNTPPPLITHPSPLPKRDSWPDYLF